MLELIIQQICQQMLEEIKEIVLTEGQNIARLIPKISLVAARGGIQIVERLIEATDEAMARDKEGRRKGNWVVERRGDVRTIMTQMGPMRYHSMNKIRQARHVIDAPTEKRSVPELHIDADEDHVALQDKRKKGNAIVPLVSVYEGIEENGARKRCKNIFHISSYKKDADTIWEDALTRIEQRYDLSDTRIYLHGDGAAWIAKGMEWLPHGTFVLDVYHKNKYIKQMLAGYEGDKTSQLRKDIDQALTDMDEDYFTNIVNLLVTHSPERERKIREAATYLRGHMADIAIRASDPAARNGGATEPHVSHVLSERLSSRPKGWRERTLQFFAPILANGPNVRIEANKPKTVSPVALNALKRTKEAYLCRKAAAPLQGSFQVLLSGKRTELYKALLGVAHNCDY